MASLAGSVVGSPRLSMRAARRWRFGSAADAGSKAMVEWCSNQSIAATTRSRDRNVWAYSADDIANKIVLTIPPFFISATPCPKLVGCTGPAHRLHLFYMVACKRRPILGASRVKPSVGCARDAHRRFRLAAKSELRGEACDRRGVRLRPEQRPRARRFGVRRRCGLFHALSPFALPSQPPRRHTAVRRQAGGHRTAH